jgi:hypothetical protein
MPTQHSAFLLFNKLSFLTLKLHIKICTVRAAFYTFLSEWQVTMTRRTRSSALWDNAEMADIHHKTCDIYTGEIMWRHGLKVQGEGRGTKFSPLKPSGNYMYQQVYHYKILRSAYTVYFCVLCGSENKQRLFHCTALTEWFYNRDGVFTARYVLPTKCIYVFCLDLRTNSDYFTIQH